MEAVDATFHLSGGCSLLKFKFPRVHHGSEEKQLLGTDSSWPCSTPSIPGPATQAHRTWVKLLAPMS